jgi:hypothetical protein
MLFDKRQLPGSFPSLQIGFAVDGIRLKRIFLEIDQASHGIPADKGRTCALMMLLHASQKVGRDADIKGAVSAAGEDVDESHRASF